MSKQFVAFFGLGKTTWCKTHLNWIDLDVSWYGIKELRAVQYLLYFYSRWDYNMLLGVGAISAMAVTEYLNMSNSEHPKQPYWPIELNVIIPGKDMKEEILDRIKARGNNSEYQSIAAMYDMSWRAADNLPFKTKVYLKPGQYLSDIIDENGEYKEGIEVLYGK